MDFLAQIEHHFKHFFSLKVALPRLPYFVFIFIHAAFWTFVLYTLLGEEGVSQLAAGGELTRETLFQRVAHLLYSAILIPLHLKRMLDAGMDVKMREIVLMWMYVPTILGTLLSDGAVALLAPALFLGSLPGVYYSIYLVFIQGDGPRIRKDV